jgi:tRNA-specific 2-thiouridylase
LGSYTKPEVRNIARKWGLPTANKKDSQGICFLGKVSLREFLSKHLGEQEGLIVTTDGKVLSKHRGAWFYTVGQRHIGTSLQVDKESAGEPWYVARKDVRTNTLVVAQGSENQALKRKVVRLTDTCFYAKTLFNGDRAEIWARVRYRQPVKKASLIKKERGYELIFSEPQKFIAPGQSAVFYSHAGLVLGGGVIV